jgi:hypothetical protein
MTLFSILPTQVCAPGKPLTYLNIGCTRLTASVSGDGDSYSFSDFSGDGYAYENSVIKGVISPAAYGGNNSTSMRIRDLV